jgi:hypothetical protein
MLQKTTNLAVLVSIVALASGAVQPIGAQVAGATLSGTIADQQGGALGGSRGFQAQDACTWSKSIDDSSGSAADDTF